MKRKEEGESRKNNFFTFCDKKPSNAILNYNMV